MDPEQQDEEKFRLAHRLRLTPHQEAENVPEVLIFLLAAFIVVALISFTLGYLVGKSYGGY